MKPLLECFNRVWVLDFEYRQPDGEVPTPWCATSNDVVTGEWRTWRYDDPTCPIPYTTGELDLVVAFAAEAEGQCILALGWPMPSHCLDLQPLYRAHRNRFGSDVKGGLIDAAAFFGLPNIGKVEKTKWRDLAIRGGPFTEDEMQGLINYCQQDVIATTALLPKLLDVVALPHALLFGRYTMRAVSHMMIRGVPVNVAKLSHMLEHKAEVKRRLVAVNRGLLGGIFDEDGHFSTAGFSRFLVARRISWPLTSTGLLCLDKETFSDRAKTYPEIGPVHELRKTMSALKNFKLAVGADGRNRSALFPFGTITGRNAPSNSKNIFGLAKWMRCYIEPPPGKVLICIDFSQQEVLVAAVLSGDRQMIEAYLSGDPYLAAANMAGAIPATGTKLSHPTERAAYKVVMLGLQYGSGAQSLGEKLRNPALGRALYEDHQRIFRRYWQWNGQVVDRAAMGMPLQTPYGWAIRCGKQGDFNPRSAGNWPVQSAGSDILRIATISMVEHGIDVIMPVHDAVIIEADAEKAAEVEILASRLMREASAAVLQGIECRVETETILGGQHYVADEQAEAMFQQVIDILNTI